MRRSLIAASAALALTLSVPALAQAPAAPVEETPAQRDARMAWWRDAKFGLFIHWGVYAVPAGMYDGKQVGGIGEWIMRNAKIPVGTYRDYAKQFNPVKYDPGAWARLAKDAGMRYMVITSKHHDGFALYDSKVTDWDIVDATPYKKDVLTPLAAAARKEGLKFGLYYSQAQDWTHPGGAKAGWKDGEGWDDAHKGSFDDYLKKIAVPQTAEIIEKFKPDILWWDTPILMTKERADLFYPYVRTAPHMITNNRLGHYKGDTDTPEQHIPATGIPGRDWEVCMTMNDTWGYKSYDNNWKSTEDLLHKLSDIVSKGGNFLLNVGPTAQGEIPQPSIDRLREVGRWMKANGEAVYGTTASPFTKLAWGRATKKIRPNGATLYLHVFNWPADGQLLAPGLKSDVRSASLLAGGKKLTAERTNEGVVIRVPATAPDPIVSVVKLEIAGPLEVAQVLPGQKADGSLTVTAIEADIHNVLGTDAKTEDKGGVTNIGFWTDPRAWVSWKARIDKPGTFEVIGDLAGKGKSRFRVTAAGQSLDAESPGTADYDQFQKATLGRITIAEPGEVEIGLRPDSKAWAPVNVRSIMLRPVAP